MVNLTDIHSLTSFLRDHRAHLERLAGSGRPEGLTVNGSVRVVIQDAEAYQQLIDRLDALETEAIVRERLASVERGEPGISAKASLERIRKRINGVSSKQKPKVRTRKKSA